MTSPLSRLDAIAPTYTVDADRAAYPVRGIDPAIRWQQAARRNLIGAGASDLAKVPAGFAVSGGKAVFVDFRNLEATLRFDAKGQTAQVTARLTFQQGEAGFPLLDLLPDAKALRVDGKTLAPSAFKTVSDPDDESQMRMVQERLPAGAHTLEITYDLPVGDLVDFDQGSVRLYTNYDDLRPRGFSEKWLPSSFEYDQHPATLDFVIEGTDRPHRIMTPAEVKTLGPNRFQVRFPEFYNTAAPFLEIIDPRKFEILETTYKGVEAEIPLVFYGSDRGELERALQITQKTFAQMERDFGPYAHKKFVALITGDIGGGMEYAGATATDLWALAHEINHSWYARAVMPQSGNAGWMDEAIASWGDNGYRRAGGVASGSRFPQLDGFSPYRRYTTSSSYGHGATVISELDYVFRNQGGLRSQLHDYYMERRYSTVTTHDFMGFLQKRTDYKLSELFSRKVFGGKPTDATIAKRQA